MKGWKLIGRGLSGVMLVVSMVIASMPVSAASTFKDVAGSYTITCNLPQQTIDGTRAVTTGRTGTLTIGTDTSGSLGVISSASIAITGFPTFAVTGNVAAGANPKIVLEGAGVVFNGKVSTNATAVTRIAGAINGFVPNADTKTLASDESGSAAGSVVAQETGAKSILLTQGAGAGSTHVDWVPQTGIKLSDLTTMSATEWGMWFDLQNDKAGGPQLELRFTSSTNTDPDSTGHVDVTLFAPTTGTGAWVHRTYDGNATAMYYGNDNVDGTAFADDAPEAISGIVASINAEGALGGASCSNWKLTRVRVELWDAGARTCYIDDVMIHGRVNGFEPAQFTGTLAAKPSGLQ
jgi:hypothetical protein